MPMPQHCIDCDKVAVVLNKDIPYCTKCYRKNVNVSRNRRDDVRAGSYRSSS